MNRMRRSFRGAPVAGGGVWTREPAGLTQFARWRNETVLAPAPWYLEANPYRTWTVADLGALTITSNSITCATGNFRSLGVGDGQFGSQDVQPQWLEVLASSQPANHGFKTLIASVSSDGRTLNFPGNPFTANGSDSSFTVQLGWGIKTRVTSGLPATPTFGGPAAIRTWSKAGARGGFDPGRIMANIPGGTTHLFFAGAIQIPAPYPWSDSEGSGKTFFVEYANGERYFVNLDLNAVGPRRWSLYRQSTRQLTTSVVCPLGVETTLEWELQHIGAGADIMRLWFDHVLAVELTNLTLPAAALQAVKFDFSNGGNKYLTGADPEPRVMATPYPGELRDAEMFCTELYASAA